MHLGQEKIAQEMDLVSFIRRKRMHGYALHFLTKQRDRALSAMLAYSKHLGEDHSHKKDKTPAEFADVQDWWGKNENLCK